MGKINVNFIQQETENFFAVVFAKKTQKIVFNKEVLRVKKKPLKSLETL